MNPRDVLKDLMTEKNVTNADMAEKLGITQASLWDRLNSKRNKSMTISVLNDMLSILGYKIVVVPKDSKTGTEIE